MPAKPTCTRATGSGRTSRAIATISRPPGSTATVPAAAPAWARSGRTSAPPATRSTAPTSCSPTSVSGCGRASPPPRQAWPEIDGPQIIALARHDPGTGTISLILDATTASTAIFALATHADEREAHIREVEHHGQNLPEGSYGRRNRQAIAARETRIADRLRAVEHAYRMAIERDAVSTPPEPTRACRSPEHVADREIELE